MKCVALSICTMMNAFSASLATAEDRPFPELMPVALQPSLIGPLGPTLPVTLELNGRPVESLLEVPELSFEFIPIEYRPGSEAISPPKAVELNKYATITLKRGAFSDGMFSDWADQIVRAVSYERYYGRITYVYLDPQRERTISHKFAKCLMQRYKPYIAYKATGAETALEEVTIRCEDLELELDDFDRRDR
ncbi:MAG: phage tail protein [Parvularculaceae bacterium]|nr:phage tail protein [Parvularculaceae bacterium]